MKQDLFAGTVFIFTIPYSFPLLLALDANQKSIDTTTFFEHNKLKFFDRRQQHSLTTMDELIEAGSLDLNIVAVPATKPFNKDEKPAGKKRKNKYDKRRQRSVRAKEIKAEKAGVASKATAAAEVPVVQAATPYGPTPVNPVEADVIVTAPSNEDVDSDDESDEAQNGPSKDDDDDDTEKVEVPTVPIPEKPADNPYDISAQTKEIPDAEEAEDVQEAEIQATSNDKKNSLPDDDEERAKYLAEFHARPMELDRRAGQVVRKVTAKDSSHLFTEATEWDKSPLHSRIVAAIQSNNFKLQRPTVIQSKAIPAFFQDDQLHNVLLQSETGSGKTLAYLLPILQCLGVDGKSGELVKKDRAQSGTRCLILCPTRELASQTFTVVEKLCKSSFNWLVPGCLLGEENRKSEKARIRKGLAIIVATPGRLLDHLTRTESLLMALKGKLEWLVLDEADRLLDMGLGEQVTQIIQRIRANQPGSGRDGITWRSALVSATVTAAVEKLAKETLLGGNNSWKWVKGGAEADDTANSTEREYTDSTPRQLSQLHMTVSAKLRLATLVAFLAQRIEKNERTVVFMSTCASVDYHHALFEALDSILDEDDDTNTGKGLFGSKCPIYRLHGSVMHGERQLVLKRFMKESSPGVTQSAVLLATDVAARGLNLHEVDWIVQYDPPGEVADYVHRAGRAARAGRAGHSLLFLLPSEQLFLDVLKKRGVKNMSAFSLTSTLNAAAGACKNLAEEGVGRSGGGLGHGSRGVGSRAGEAFASEIQRRMEDVVVRDEARVKAANKEAAKKAKKNGMKSTEVLGSLSDLARNAFLSHIRAYPTKEKLVKHIFPAKALHLGHVARSFALKEPPKKLGTRTQKPASAEADESRKRNKKMAFEVDDAVEGSSSKRTKNGQSKTPSTTSSDRKSDSHPQKGKRAELFENAARLQNNGLGSL
jgi:ATP-dependent RNA helicase DDX31/DBP7